MNEALHLKIETDLYAINEYANLGYSINEVQVRLLIKKLSQTFRDILVYNGLDLAIAKKITTKFRDAGRRSAPWQPTSSLVPGRPQNGSDGNRINRWLLPEDHKFYATEVKATLVECKYLLQTLSMANAPVIPSPIIKDSFIWLTGHEIVPGRYKDPIQIVDINFFDFYNDRRTLQSGHFVPLNRGGRHIPDNTFLMLYRSNQIQGDQTFEELMEFMKETLRRHGELPVL
ncbi:hypothetical protein M3592_27690 [Priestia aryabhattai]|uniref:hypothetical protein n=1 Tax=Priestia aryabhattai TaxID=412384 RepID=UPI00203AEA79|nr:hypothetical protein [Priestia aryabhattai]MCM2979180.1 hypothetical protein [Priestia aryabhattai]